MSSGRPLGSLLATIRLWALSASYPSGTYLGSSDGCRASAVVVHLLGAPINIVVDALLAGFFEVFGLDNHMLIHRDQVLALDHVFGHWIFLLLGDSNAASPLNCC